jgi:hypothetical protein
MEKCHDRPGTMLRRKFPNLTPFLPAWVPADTLPVAPHTPEYQKWMPEEMDAGGFLGSFCGMREPALRPGFR